MKKFFRLTIAVLVAAAALTSCSRSYKTVKNDPLQTKIYTLDNGLKVFMSVNKETPRIQTYIAVKVGSKNDPSETTGLAHYFEHLMFKGTQSFGTSDYEAEKPLLDEIENLFELYRKTTDEDERMAIYHKIDSVSYEASKISIPNEYDKLMAMIGADGTNAWTSDDETVYTEDIPSNQIDNWARIQADRFRNNVIRGFHTELETIYEEKNMSLTQDNRKVWESISAALYPHHPYGTQTTLGTQEHLKNPSITNVKKYHDTYYVPNNIAICVSGDFDPDEMVAAIEKYFGDWEPNPSIPSLQFEPEQPITEPIVKDVYGLENEMFALAWRIPGAADLQTSAVAEIASSILSNGQAGLVDLDVNQQQKAMYLSGGAQIQPDYGQFVFMGRPKRGQALEELTELTLEEVAKLAAGEFSEGLIEASINNIKMSLERSLERNSSRAQTYVNAFINGIDWADACHEIDRLQAVTKEDVIAFAKEYLTPESYVVVYKRKGVDDSVQKISAPAITPILANRDKQSDFLKEIQATVVKPIEPVYVDFSKEMSQFDITDGVNVLYKHNDVNGIFNLSYIYNFGTEDNPALTLASDYISYLGTPTMSADSIAVRMYELACSFGIRSGNHATTVYVSGLQENMEEAMAILEDLVFNAVADEDILESCKSDLLKSRIDAKTSQRSCYSALTRYVQYGPEYVRKGVMSNEDVIKATSEQLLSSIKDVAKIGHEVIYYGPASESEVKAAIQRNHFIEEGCQKLPEVNTMLKQNNGNSVVLAQYDAKQLYYFQYSNRGEIFDAAEQAEIDLYNEYFGGGMNGIVFQEMREARGLCYSANASLRAFQVPGGTYSFSAFIATQNDKLQIAAEAFSDIINNMPESEQAFSVAKDGLISRMRTARTTGMGVINAYRRCRQLGIDEPLDRAIFEKLQDMTLENVKATQQKWVGNRDYTYCILGDIADLDMNFLRTLGPVKIVSLDDIFGY